MTNHITNTEADRHGVLAGLRSRLPRRRLSLAESFRIAELQANVFLELTDVDDAPIDLELLESLPRLRLVHEPDMLVSGAAHWSGGAWIVTVNADEPLTRRRYSAFHELKHIIDHPIVGLMYQGDRTVTPEQQRERVADYFSACVLMPKRIVKRLWGQGINQPAQLASLFHVSERAMRFRLDQLGLSLPRQRCDRPNTYRRSPSTRPARLVSYERALA